MKFYLLFCILISNICYGQHWQAEIMGGVAGYNGDLTEKRININELRPAGTLNIKYNSGDFVNFRIGVSYASVGADDKNNPNQAYKNRNLNFKTNIVEINAAAEIVLLDPEVYTAYPFVFGGIGIFHFNPYTYDNNGKKTYLQPLSTAGQGLPDFPDRKKYSLTQPCIPVGFGWKWTINDKWDISYEFGYRILFTDYLDDVSANYVDLDYLTAQKGAESAELSYRGKGPLTPENVRGNPKVKDIYYFTGIKLATNLSNLFGKKEKAIN